MVRTHHLQEIIQDRSVKLLPVGLLTQDGGMPEYYRIWQSHYRDLGLQVQGLERHDENVCLLNHRNFLRMLSITKSICGLSCSARLLTACLRRLGPYLGERSVAHITTFVAANDVIVWGLLNEFPRLRILNTLHDPRPHTERRNRIGDIIRRQTLRNCLRMGRDCDRYFIHVHGINLLDGLSLAGGVNVVAYEHPLPKRRSFVRNETEKVRIGFLGRIQPYKGVDVFVRSLQVLQSKCPELLDKTELLIAGDGRFDERSLEKLSLSKFIENRFLGDDEFHRLMASLDILVLPYLEATQSGVAAMGRAYGCFVVASHCGGIPSLLQGYENSTLVPPGDVEALASAIQSALKSTARRLSAGDAIHALCAKV
jgi:glycosyltransferase involved in cell wall biosynthesis